MGTRLQQVKQNYPSRAYKGASYANLDVSDGAKRFGYDFGNIVLTTMVNPQEVPDIQVLVSFPQQRQCDHRINKNQIIQHYCISNGANRRFASLGNHKRNRSNPSTRLARRSSSR